MILSKILLVVVFGLACLATSSQAQTPTPEHTHLSAAERALALKSIKEKFQELYVFSEMRSKIVERLNQAQQAGRYEVDDPHIFADRITSDMREVAHDKHLALLVDPAAYAAALAPPQSDAGEEAFRHQRAIRNHDGLTEMRILPGNIRSPPGDVQTRPVESTGGTLWEGRQRLRRYERQFQGGSPLAGTTESSTCPPFPVVIGRRIRDRGQ